MKYVLWLLLSFPAFGFYLNTNISASFGSSKVLLYVTSNSTCSNAGFSAQDLLDIAYDGAKKFWNTVPTANLEIKKGGILQTTDANFLTGKLCVDQGNCNETTDIAPVTEIVIACNSNTTDNFTSSSLYALSAPNNLSNSKIRGSVILVNDTSTTQINGLSRAEMVNVMGHEIGHAIGIGHSKDKAALMYYQSLPHRDHLGQDDIDAVTYLYPNKLDGCTSIFGTINDGDNSGPWSFFLTSLFGLLLMTYVIKPIFITVTKFLHRQTDTAKL